MTFRSGRVYPDEYKTSSHLHLWSVVSLTPTGKDIMSYKLEHLKEQRIRKFNVQGHHYSLSMDLTGSYAELNETLYGVIESKFVFL